MGVLQLDPVLVEEVLGNCALDSLASLQLERERLSLSWSPRYVAHSILSSHLATVGDLDLQTPARNAHL